MRVDGWESLLASEIEAARARPFSWGSHDCATWAADVRRALTGHDLAAAWRGTYRDARGAKRSIRATGAGDLVEAVSMAIGKPLPSVLMAGRGDVVTDGAALGICLGRDAAFLSRRGLAFRPLAACLHGWRV